MDDKWLNNLRNKMEDHSEDVPDGLWDDISKELFQKEDDNTIVGIGSGNEVKAQKQSIQHSFKRKIYRAVAVAATIAVCFFVGKELFNIDFSDQKIRQSKATYSNNNVKKGNKTLEKKEISKSNEKIIAEQNIGDDNWLNNSFLSQKFAKNKTAHNIREERETENILSKNQEEFSIEKLFNQNPNTTKENTAVKEYTLPDKIQENNEILADNKQLLSPEKIEETRLEKQQSKKWMLSMLTGNASSGSTEQFPGYANVMGNPMRATEVYQSSEATPLLHVLMANQNKEVEARIRHKTPVNFGLSLYYNLGKNWGVGTGLNYTKLSSEIHSGSESNYVKTDQSVHYLGIPVQVNYNVVKKGKFTGYVTAGTLVEKAISGKQKTQYVVDNKIEDSSQEKIDLKPLQFSVNSAVGIQYKIINNIGVYAEPGVSYHFKDDSQLNTIYKEKPFNFNVKFGIRIQID
ncbi:porin family protein [Chryseobacterium oryctis]|uniref:PorT family protein n=1 Tax=Chryseobacterium oryctis TaxID=2952618 RepID=A0ABT3HLE8_9FLAO|nr:porin family protein [Chryseobacterium oryctis]MCW3160605.1 PorT family protein [Chryseobacterium oryctis]